MYSVIATLKFILENSITFNVNDTVLNKELIDLGLPKGNLQNNKMKRKYIKYHKDI